MEECMSVKYFEWSSAADKVEILPAPGAMKRYRILSAPMACNEETGVAILFAGATGPSDGSTNVVDFVDSVRHTNDAPLSAPYLSEKNIAINLKTTDSGGTTGGRGMIVYIKETH